MVFFLGGSFLALETDLSLVVLGFSFVHLEQLVGEQVKVNLWWKKKMMKKMSEGKWRFERGWRGKEGLIGRGRCLVSGVL